MFFKPSTPFSPAMFSVHTNQVLVLSHEILRFTLCSSMWYAGLSHLVLRAHPILDEGHRRSVPSDGFLRLDYSRFISFSKTNVTFFFLIFPLLLMIISNTNQKNLSLNCHGLQFAVCSLRESSRHKVHIVVLANFLSNLTPLDRTRINCSLWTWYIQSIFAYKTALWLLCRHGFPFVIPNQVL